MAYSFHTWILSLSVSRATEQDSRVIYLLVLMAEGKDQDASISPAPLPHSQAGPNQPSPVSQVSPKPPPLVADESYFL